MFLCNGKKYYFWLIVRRRCSYSANLLTLFFERLFDFFVFVLHVREDFLIEFGGFFPYGSHTFGGNAAFCGDALNEKVLTNMQNKHKKVEQSLKE